jgi:hypothetical protein
MHCACLMRALRRLSACAEKSENRIPAPWRATASGAAMSSTITLVDPTAAVEGASDNARFRLDSLQGKVVGFVDNSKQNFDHLAAAMGQLLTAKHGVQRVLTHRKPAASIPAETHALEALVAECDLVIAGSGD